MNGITMGIITSVRTRPAWRDGASPIEMLDDDPYRMPKRERHFEDAEEGVDYWVPSDFELAMVIRTYRDVKDERPRDPGPFWYRHPRELREYHVPLRNREEIQHPCTSCDQPVWWEQIGQ